MEWPKGSALRRMAEVGLYVFGSMEELMRRKMLTPGSAKILPLGISEYDQLLASGFKPSSEEMDEFIKDTGIVGKDQTQRYALRRLIELLHEGKLPELALD
jgi:hypothetical protein